MLSGGGRGAIGVGAPQILEGACLDLNIWAPTSTGRV